MFSASRYRDFDRGTVRCVRLELDPSLNPTDYPYAHTLRVRFAETDAMGIVHHSRYLPYLEEARVEYLRHLGHPYVELRAEGVDYAVLEVFVQYRQPLRFDESVQVHLHRLVEAQRLAILHEHLQHRIVHPLGTELHVRVAQVTQVLHSGFLEIGQVATVVHDAHRVGLGEAHSQRVGVRVVRGVQRRIQFEAHAAHRTAVEIAVTASGKQAAC